MTSSASTTYRQHGRQRLIEPAVLAQLNNLELLARTVVEGALTGRHRSPNFGFSQEFAEYRAYVPGDDLRHIDWNVFARSDRLVVKRFYGDTNCQLMVLLDTSASMAASKTQHRPTAGAVSKLDYARFLTAALIYLAHRQHDAVGLLTFSDGIDTFRPPVARAAGVTGLYHTLDDVRASGGTNWQLPLEHVQAQLNKKSLLVVVSDFYTEPDALGQALRGLAARGNDLLMVHVLEPAERALRLDRAATLEDAETGRVIEVTAEEVADAYPRRLREHLEALRTLTLSIGGHYLQVDTDEPLDRCLARYMRFRARHP